MPKRSTEDKIEKYEAKIKKLQDKQKPRFRRCIVYSDSDSSNSDDSDNEKQCEKAVASEVVPVQVEPNESEEQTLNPDTSPDPIPEEPELDIEFLTALGGPVDISPVYGEKIHQSLADRWLPILLRGVVKEPKEQLLKEQFIPENCKLLKAPALNPEISAALTEVARHRDKKLETNQHQLGLGITAINRAMTVLFSGDDKQIKVESIKILSDACRILTDLHFMQTQARIKLITPALDKSFLAIIKDNERDELLFGKKLSESIKASKAIEKQGLQIKKTTALSKATTPSTSQITTRSRYQGNWSAPPRYHTSNRGGRAVAQRTLNTNQKSAPQAPPIATRASSNFNKKPRAAPRH